jgi:hypothetical protein
MLPLLVVGLVVVASASASSPLLVFDRPAAAPHEFVVAKNARKGALLRVRKRPLRLSIGGVDLGRLKVNRKGNGRLRFGVPNLPAGVYDVMLRGLPGRPALRPVGSFEVANGPVAVRSCEQSVYGKLSEDYIARSLHVGPLRFIGYDPAVASTSAWMAGLRIRTGQYAQKILMLVERGAQATISIAPQDRREIALMYIPERFNLQRVTDGDAAVTLRACSEAESEQPYTQFNGGVVFRQPLCAHVEVEVAGRPEPIRITLPFGKTCPSR